MQIFLGSYRLSLDHKWKNFFYVWELEKSSVEHEDCVSNCEEISRGTKISLGIMVPYYLLRYPWKFPHNLKGNPFIQLNVFPYPIHKKGFPLYDPVTICNFTEKPAENKCICLES